jgi:hypothetical protein
MIVKFGEQSHCKNPTWDCKLLVQSKTGIEGRSNPSCVYRALMEKTYAPPHFAYLEFQRVADSVVVREGSREG